MSASSNSVQVTQVQYNTFISMYVLSKNYNIRSKKIIWKLVLLLELIIFYKMNTDNDALLKILLHLVI